MVRNGLKKIFSRFYNDESGITGLETAIVLIAFVVVAAVFAFTVLTTGLFTSEKAKETALAGVATTSSSLTIKGSVVASGDDATVNVIRVKLATATGVERVEFNPEKLIITYLDDASVGQFAFPAIAANGLLNDVVDGPPVQSRIDTCAALPTDFTWCYVRKGPDALLDPGEVHELFLFLGKTTPALTENKQFTIEIIPQDGAVIRIQRRTPLSLAPVMNLN
jgi:flagellin FlaB